MVGRRWPGLPHQARSEEYYEELARIINLCQSISTKSDDPFLVDIPQKLMVLKRLLPKWKLIDELLMDAEAIRELSMMVKLQSDWVKRRASGLFVDPFLVEVKIKLLSKETLANSVLASWHPLVALDQITPERLQQALDYWNSLLPLSQRAQEILPDQDSGDRTVEISELIRLRFISDRTFNEEMTRMRQRLVEETKSGPVDYWKLVLAPTYEETVMNAYNLSFLVSKGLANLIINPVEETIKVEASDGCEDRKGGRSVVISISYEKWRSLVSGGTAN
ncbi:MAG: hypothetical protein QFX35_06555 [Candidatus Verstraetearchaeota archaeon]|nr:hypothetical protein [Candidatus Verstraetearchaeota archaeon]